MATAILLTLLSTLGQDPAPPPREAPPPPQEAPKIPDDFKPDPAWRALGRDVWFDPARRAVVLRTRVCLREGFLEHLLCREQTKEHESVLATDAPPRMIHAGLILAVGEPGHPVRYQPDFEAPTGPPVDIQAEWSDADGRRHRIDARQFVKEQRSGKPLDVRWVFAGSVLFQDPETKRVIYAADGGDLFTVANFSSAILDLPIASSNSDAERAFVADTEHIPPRNTQVTLILSAPKDAAPAVARPKAEPEPKSEAPKDR
jgi:hypothetical protein